MNIQFFGGAGTKCFLNCGGARRARREPALSTNTSPRSLSCPRTSSIIFFVLKSIHGVPFAVNNKPNRPQTHPQPSATRSITRSGRSRCASTNKPSSTTRLRSNSCSCLLFPFLLPSSFTCPALLTIVFILPCDGRLTSSNIDQRRTRKTRQRWQPSISRTERRCSRMPSRRIPSSARSGRVATRQRRQQQQKVRSSPLKFCEASGFS